jgi:hypothetical protein
MACKTTPIELILATGDQNLYSDSKWLIGQPLYWSVGCLIDEQYTVSDNYLPTWVNKNSFVAITTNPNYWDFCISKNCNSNSKSFHILFTFNPDSTNTIDYLQYVVTLDRGVTDYSIKSITDTNGKPFYLTLSVNKDLYEPYLEIWISKSSALNVPQPPVPAGFVETKTVSSFKNIFFVIFIFIIILIIVGSLLFLIFRE